MTTNKYNNVILCFPGVGKADFREKMQHTGEFISVIKLSECIDGTWGSKPHFINLVPDHIEKHPNSVLLCPGFAPYIEALQVLGIPHTAVVPSKELKEEYKLRWNENGETEMGKQVLDNNWDIYLDEIAELDQTNIITYTDPEMYLVDDFMRSRGMFPPMRWPRSTGKGRIASPVDRDNA